MNIVKIANRVKDIPKNQVAPIVKELTIVLSKKLKKINPERHNNKNMNLRISSFENQG